MMAYVLKGIQEIEDFLEKIAAGNPDTVSVCFITDKGPIDMEVTSELIVVYPTYIKIRHQSKSPKFFLTWPVVYLKDNSKLLGIIEEIVVKE